MGGCRVQIMRLLLRLSALLPGLLFLLGAPDLGGSGTHHCLLSQKSDIASNIQQHSLRKRDLQPESHIERLQSFSALQRFQALIVDGKGKEREYPVHRCSPICSKAISFYK
uniref:Uncharacterized protein n=1 Tax=Sphenodon punctatus TaxID=8508 RepID=A0A8D0G565_SPHPU